VTLALDCAYGLAATFPRLLLVILTNIIMIMVRLGWRRIDEPDHWKLRGGQYDSPMSR
jgi:hypothetical protein